MGWPSKEPVLTCEATFFSSLLIRCVSTTFIPLYPKAGFGVDVGFRVGIGVQVGRTRVAVGFGVGVGIWVGSEAFSSLPLASTVAER